MSKSVKKKPQPTPAVPKTDKQYLLSGLVRRLPRRGGVAGKAGVVEK